jgi:hypothetical protein
MARVPRGEGQQVIERLLMAAAKKRASGGGGPADPFDAFVKLNSDFRSASSLIDKKGHTWEYPGTPNFNADGLLFNGGSYSSEQATIANSADFLLGTADWTVEVWFKLFSAGVSFQTLIRLNSTNGGFSNIAPVFTDQGNAGISTYSAPDPGSTSWQGGGQLNMAYDTMMHWACMRRGGNILHSYNGAASLLYAIGGAAMLQSGTQLKSVHLGNWESSAISARIAQVRVTIGADRYAPVAGQPFTPDANF